MSIHNRVTDCCGYYLSNISNFNVVAKSPNLCNTIYAYCLSQNHKNWDKVRLHLVVSKRQGLYRMGQNGCRYQGLSLVSKYIVGALTRLVQYHCDVGSFRPKTRQPVGRATPS